LIVIHGELQDVQNLKIILDDFAEATGLRINFSKSTAVPIHMDGTILGQCIDVLGCKKEAFPQCYLGLPLSTNKLSVSAFAPSIAKADRYLAGWQAGLLNAMGRTVLINVVLDSQLIYAMCALPIPPGVIAQVNQRRRAFLWNGDRTLSGAQSLVAWERVCWTRENGGLGIKDLGLMNVCLLLKLLHRLHIAEDSAWTVWARQHTSLANLDSDLCGSHWQALRSLLPLYQAVTSVTIGDGSRTSFWYDAWVDDEALADRFPVLHNHCARKGFSVAQIQASGIDSSQLWVPRMSQQAQSELNEVRTILLHTQFTDTVDSRKGPLCLPKGKFDSGSLY
jgi:hypothetical protein